MIRALLFDFGGTLDGPLHWLDRFLLQYRAAGIEIEREQLDPAFDFATSAGYRATRVVQRFGLIDLVRFLVGNQAEFLMRHAPPAVGTHLASVGSRERHRLVEQITEGFVAVTRQGLKHSGGVLSRLKEDFWIGVVSNFYGNLDRILEEAGMKGIVDSSVDSSRLGIFKPAPGIFEAALRTLRVSPAEAVMIGDSLEKDCAPAHRLGIRTGWYRSDVSTHPRPDDGYAVDFTIGSLEELADLPWQRDSRAQ